MLVDTPTMLYTHSNNLYQVLKEQAELVEGKLVWTGFMTHIVRDKLHLSVPYYTQILNALKGMGCVEQLRRGGSSTPSIWLLLKEPTQEAFDNPTVGASLRKSTRLEQLENQVMQLAGRLDTIETLLRQGVEI